MRKAFITGITGQDGSYLAELLLEKGYEVHGLIRRSSLSNLDRISHLINSLHLHEGDLGDSLSLKRAIETSQPHEVYNLAAMSHVKTSFDMPEYAADVDGLGTLRLLDTIRSFDPKIRFYQASTSELYGNAMQTPQTENTPFHPRSPYAVAKLYAYWITANYREAYGIHASNGILFNHESPRRGGSFVSKKITQGAARIARGVQEKIALGNLDAVRDWGYAKDFVEGMWLMLQQDMPDDYVLATGKAFTVRRFAELAFQEVGISLAWEGKGIEEKGRDLSSGNVCVEVSPQFFRPAEVDALIGDASKARKKLGWAPRTHLPDLIRIMVQTDLAPLEECLSEARLGL